MQKTHAAIAALMLLVSAATPSFAAEAKDETLSFFDFDKEPPDSPRAKELLEMSKPLSAHPQSKPAPTQTPSKPRTDAPHD